MRTTNDRQLLTAVEYNTYAHVVNSFFTREGIDSLSPGDYCDTFFSVLPCDCCRRDLPGDRHISFGCNRATDRLQEYEVCDDCLSYIDYDHLEDLSTLSITHY